MHSPRRRPARWARSTRRRGIDLAVASNKIWTKSYERELARWCEKLRGAVDSTTANVLDARIAADRDDDLARLWQVAALSLDGIGEAVARCDHQATVARAKANALTGQVRIVEQQLQEVDHQLTMRRALTLSGRASRPLTMQQRT